MEVFISILKTRQLSNPPHLALPKKQNAEAGVRHAIIGKFNNRPMLAQDLFNIGLSRSSRRLHFILFFSHFVLVPSYSSLLQLFHDLSTSEFSAIFTFDTSAIRTRLSIITITIYKSIKSLRNKRNVLLGVETYLECQQEGERTKWNERIINNKHWASVKHSFYRGQFWKYMPQCEDAFLTRG